MAKFISRLFSSASLSTKRGSYRGSQSSINDNARKNTGQANMRAASSLENISSYYVTQKELDKSKLHKASWEGNLQKVERLAGPAQINAKDQHARTPLHLAVVRGHTEIVRHLVHEGAKLNVLDNEQRTPLLKAVLSGNQHRQVNYEICHILLDGGADAFINAVDVRGKNALHYAIEFDNEDLVDLFLSYPHCDPSFRDGDQMTPLHLAVKKNNRHIVESLLSDEHEQQADPNLVNRTGQTPLHMAATAGYIDIIRVMLQAELEEPCDPTIVDSQQLTAYQIAKINHHDPCANIINEYQQGWTKLSPRRDEFQSINEQEINPVVINPSQQQQQQQQPPQQQQQPQQRYQQDSSDETSSDTASESSRSSSNNRKPQPNQWSPYQPTETKPETRTLADLIKNNPVQPPDVPQTNGVKPNNQVFSGLMHSIPLQPTESSAYKPVTPQQPKQQPPSIFGIGPASLQHHETDRTTSTSMSIDKPLIGTNLIVARPSPPSQKPSTINSIIGALPQPTSSNTNSLTYDSTFPNQQIKQARKIDSWTDSSPSQSDDDDRTGVYNTKPPQTQQLPSLNGTAMFTTTPAAAISHHRNFDDSKSDEDSIEAAVKKTLNQQSPSNGVQSLVNKQLGTGFQFPQQSSIPNPQSPRSDESSWTQSSSVTINKGVQALVQQQPLVAKKSSEHTWDDSRPLSADLKRTSIISNSQQSTHSDTTDDDDDDDNDKKSATIVKSPFLGSALSSLVQKNIHPNEYSEHKTTTGVDNLVKIINDIMHSVKSAYKPSISPNTIGNIGISPLVRRDDSLSSSASSYIDDTVRPLALTAPAAINTKQHLYNDVTEQQTWSGMTGDGHDFKLVKRNYSNEMIQQSQRQASRASVPPDFNSLRGSMSSSTSSIQNNIERISELKEDIKQIERKQEDSLELKRQLKDMEIKKNNFEALYKKNDQLLRETETKLEKEIGEKQRLEWTTKNLNMELKNVSQRLQALEEEKEILNQRCLKLKEERDNYDEKFRIHQANSIQTTATAVLREEDVEKIKLRHREEMKLLSAENDELHQRTKQLQSDLQLHKESLDVTIRYKIDLEKALEEKNFLQHELDRLKHEKDYLEQDKLEYKTKNDNLQEEIRLILADRSKLEQKLNNDSQEQMKQRQRSADDIKKYKTQIEQLNMKLGDAEARLLVLQTQNEALIASKDREIKNEFESLTHRLNMIESEKLNAEQRYHNEHREIINRQQQHALHEPLVVLAPTPLNNTGHHQHSPSSTCTKCDTLQKSYEQEREQRLQTEKEYARLRDVVSRQQNENVSDENNKQLRTELERLRQDMNKLVLNYDPPHNYQQKAQLHTQIDSFRKFHENEFRQQQLPMPTKVHPTTNGYHQTKHNGYDHSMNGHSNCSVCSNSRLLKERLDNAIDTSLADQRIQAIKQMPILPRQTMPLLTINTNDTSSVSYLRKRYYL